MTQDFVRVRAPARLHLGFLDPGGASRRRFGGIGLALDAPATVLRVRRADRASGEGPDGSRAGRLLFDAAQALGIERAHAVEVEAAIPPHAGLGSGTQLALAVSAALRAIEGLPPDPEGDALRLGRGARSGLGAAFFSAGGLVVDGGRAPDTAGVTRPPIAPVVSRLPFPEAWRVLLILEPSAEGFHGAAELSAFAALPPFPASGVAEICRLVLMGALPALAEADIAGFGQAIGTIQAMVGSHFAPAQGGVFASPRVARIVGRLGQAGAHGPGQSSWGPTGFAFAPSPDEAERLTALVRPDAEASSLRIAVVRGRNEGASVELGRGDGRARLVKAG